MPLPVGAVETVAGLDSDEVLEVDVDPDPAARDGPQMVRPNSIAARQDTWG